jgi:GNAT superfamily N-acetyltransferase
MDETTVVRFAAPGDADRIAALSTQLGYPASGDDVARLMAALAQNPDHVVLIAADADGSAVGWVHVFLSRRVFVAPFAELGGLIVDESRRGSGVGAALLSRAEEWAREAGCALLRVRTNVLRAGAHDFYRRAGYAVIKEQRVLEKEL